MEKKSKIPLNVKPIFTRAIVVGDHTMSVLEIWGAEYQEQDAILVKRKAKNVKINLNKLYEEKLTVVHPNTQANEEKIKIKKRTYSPKLSIRHR